MAPEQAEIVLSQIKDYIGDSRIGTSVCLDGDFTKEELEAIMLLYFQPIAVS